MKIAIIDDHPLVRQGLSAVFSLEDNIDVVGEADSLESGIRLFKNTSPDVALIDLRLGADDGLSLVEELSKLDQKCKFIILTSSSDKDDFVRAINLGVHGYMLKESLPEELLYGILLINKGRKFYDPELLEYQMQATEDGPVEQLTEKEQEVLRALGMGLANKQIAKELYITEYTVKKHVSQILAKLELNDRTQAALYANSQGIAKYEYHVN